MGDETKIGQFATSKKSVQIICSQIAPILTGKSIPDALIALSALFAEVARNERAPQDRSFAVHVLEQTAKVIQTPK